jgi:hypothetical protein
MTLTLMRRTKAISILIRQAHPNSLPILRAFRCKCGALISLSETIPLHHFGLRTTWAKILKTFDGTAPFASHLAQQQFSSDVVGGADRLGATDRCSYDDDPTFQC